MEMAEPEEPSVQLAIHADNRLMREALSASLATRPGFVVVGTTATIDELEALCAEHQPHVALVDAEALPPAADALRRLRRVCPRTDLVAIAPEEVSSDVLAATARAGVAALVSGADGLEAVLSVLRERTRGNGQAPHATPRLTDRETMVICLMGAGHSAPEIASLLRLRTRTVENHKRHIYAKLGVGTQSHAVSRAISLGLLDPPTEPEGHARIRVEPGRSMLVVVHGPPGPCRDEVMQALVVRGLPFVFVKTPGSLADHHGIRWHRGPLAVLLVDPQPEDWQLFGPLGAATVVVRSGVPDQAAIVDVLVHGAAGLVFRDDVAVDLGSMLACVARGHFAMSGVYASALARWAPVRPTGAPQLTARERDILGSIASGHTIRQTARVLGIAAKTVENTQSRLFRKLGARNRAETLTIADGWGLVDRAAGLVDRGTPVRVPASVKVNHAMRGEN
jgi:DNA-binding NarL/FixJ family response regulator